MMLTMVTAGCRITDVPKRQTVYDRIEILMSEKGDNPTSLSVKLTGDASKRELVRQIKKRFTENPDSAGASGRTLEQIAKHYDVSMHWLQAGGTHRGRFSEFETADPRGSITAIASQIGVRQSVIEYVLAQNPDWSDSWALFGLLYSLESAARAGGKVPEIESAQRRPIARPGQRAKR